MSSHQSEKERLEEYHRSCYWVGRNTSPLRGTQNLNRRPSIQDVLRPHLTEERAKQIRDWRCGLEPCSWKRVAELAYEKWDRPEWVVAHPFYGEALCKLSAIILGEDPEGELWNNCPGTDSLLEEILLKRAKKDWNSED